MHQIRDLRQGLGLAIGTGLGSGLFRWAPGTVGSAAALPLVLWTNTLPPWIWSVFWITVFVAGIFSAGIVDEFYKSSDNRRIVVDEFVGMAITAYGLGLELLPVLTAFFLFRFFDVLKIWPVRNVDRWSKKKAAQGQHLWGGFGVMFDDVLAGIQGLAVMIALRHYGFFEIF